MRSTLTKPRVTHGAAKKKMAPRMKTPTTWKKLPSWSQYWLPGKMPRISPQTGRPPPPLANTPVRQAKASHHRLTATKTPRMVQGTLTAR